MIYLEDRVHLTYLELFHNDGFNKYSICYYFQIIKIMKGPTKYKNYSRITDETLVKVEKALIM